MTETDFESVSFGDEGFQLGDEEVVTHKEYDRLIIFCFDNFCCVAFWQQQFSDNNYCIAFSNAESVIRIAGNSAEEIHPESSTHDS